MFSQPLHRIWTHSCLCEDNMQRLGYKLEWKRQVNNCSNRGECQEEHRPRRNIGRYQWNFPERNITQSRDLWIMKWRSSEIKWTKPNKWWDWLTGLCVEGWRLPIDESVKKTGSEWSYLLWHLYSLTFYLFCLFWNLCDKLCDIIICLLFFLNFTKIYLFGDF